jgi:hypothetical protein
MRNFSTNTRFAFGVGKSEKKSLLFSTITFITVPYNYIHSILYLKKYIYNIFTLLLAEQRKDRADEGGKRNV